MGKRVIFNGIEVFTSEDKISARSFFDFTEEVVGLLETELGETDANFSLSISTDFSMNRPPKHRIYVNGLKNTKTKEKLVRILIQAGGRLRRHANGTARVNLVISDR